MPRTNNASELAPRGWHSRGYLPHFDGGNEQPQTVTFRLADSVPHPVIERWRMHLESLPTIQREVQLRKLYEKYMDAGHGSCVLRDMTIGSMVESAILHCDAERYFLHAWVVMPNHVHVVYSPAEKWTMSAVVGGWKSFTGKEANRILGRTGRFWQENYFDRFIRDEDHFARAVEYVEQNPVTAGLCALATDWPLSSARRRETPDRGQRDAVQRVPESRAAETAALPGETHAESATCSGESHESS